MPINMQIEYPKLKAESTRLKYEIERLEKINGIHGLLALEFGYKQCEKGDNIQAAFLNYNAAIAKRYDAICVENKDKHIQGWMEKFNEEVGKHKTAKKEIERIKRIVSKSLYRFANCKTEADLHKAILTLKTI